VARFSPGLNNTPRRVRQSVRLPGTCSGTLVDGGGWTHKLSDAPVTYSETAVADGASCASGTPTGRGSLRFRWGNIGFAFAEKRVGVLVVVTLTGRRGGSATGYAAPTPGQDPLAAVQACGGSGIKEAHIDAHATTTPSISG
jgi:hypothetical protein